MPRIMDINHVAKFDGFSQLAELIANTGVGSALIGQNGNIGVFELKPVDEYRFYQSYVVFSAQQ